ncbi:MAG: hypothetical protein WDN67_03945 [Candidatus Moraniibacteriota bacterium]
MGLETAPPPPPIPTPPPPEEELPVPPLEEQPSLPPEEARKGCFDWNAVVGTEKELVGGTSLSVMLPALRISNAGAANTACTNWVLAAKPLPGTDVSIMAAVGYSGDWFQIGPAYQYIDDNCWNLELKAPMIGRLNEKFREGDYRSHRRFTTLGVDVSANWYKPRCESKKGGIREVQVNASIGVPLSRSVGHTWEGNPSRTRAISGSSM